MLIGVSLMSVRKWTVKRLGAEAPSTETKKITREQQTQSVLEMICSLKPVISWWVRVSVGGCPGRGW